MTKIEALNKIKEIKVHGNCCKCKKRIEMNWDELFILNGNFMSEKSSHSEVFNNILPRMHTLICMDCFIFKGGK